jgi:uncharacterized membrane protein
MSYQGQDPNRQGQHAESDQYGSGYTPPQQPADPYSSQQYGHQPPYGQPSGYQQPYDEQQYSYQPPQGQPSGYQRPYETPSFASTSLGLSQNLAAALSYVFVWISGLIVFLVEKQNRFVRFHAMQSILFFGGLSILRVMLNIIAGSDVLLVSPLASFLGALVFIVGIVGWIVLVVNAFQGKYFKLPIVGDYAEKYANQVNL